MQAVRQFSQGAENLIERGDFEFAETVLRRALEVVVTKKTDPRNEATVYNNLGHVLAELGNSMEAEALYKRAIECWRLDGNDGNSFMATSMSNLAALHKREGRIDEAEKLYRRALEIDMEAWGTQHPDVATDFNNLGSLSFAKGNLLEARRFFHNAATIYEVVSPSSDSGFDESIHATWHAMSLSNMAEVDRSLGDYDKAERALERATTILESFDDVKPSSLAITLSNYGRVKQDQLLFEDAERLYKRAMSTWNRTATHDDLANEETVLAPSSDLESDEWRHLEQKAFVASNRNPIAKSLSNLGIVYQLQGNLSAASYCFRKSLSIRVRFQEHQNPIALPTLNNLGRLLQQQGHFANAEQVLRQCTSILEQREEGCYADDGPACFNNLGSVLQDKGELEEAEVMYRRAIQLWEAKFGPGSGPVATGLNNIGNLLLQQGKLNEALEVLRQSLRLLELELGLEHPNTVRTRFNVVIVSWKNGLFDQAADLLEVSDRIARRKGRCLSTLIRTGLPCPI